MKKCRLIIIYFIILSINLKGQIQNNQPRDNNHIIHKTIFNLDELKVRWRKASLENCPEGKCPVFTTPGPVRALMVSPLPLSAIVSFLPPLNDGGSLITGYVVTAQQTASAPAKRKLSSTITVSGISSPILVTGLAFGVNYNFNVVAINAVGSSVPIVTTMPVTPAPATVPDAPTSVVATAGNIAASVTFIAPVNTGGNAITGYTVTSSPGSFTGTGTTSPIIVSGLTNGTAYTFTVVATNAVGPSIVSAASVAVIPATVPDAPTSIVATAGNAQASVTFIAPVNTGGNAITGYTVTSSPGSFTGTG
ncbi:MAG: fibronectin type III domain-containing protein, partial [Saprospiraceae bacterium]|nr:fibronectin type III domain-containing protein [Saprospiraceae bacterium]